MNANELRKGNLIIGTYEKEEDNLIHETICEFKFYNCYDNYYFVESKDGIENFSGFKPIPLTEELLLKCGFEIRIEVESQKYYRNNGFEIVWDELDNCFCFKRSLLKFIDITSIHQLQNIFFALTNQELKINL